MSSQASTAEKKYVYELEDRLVGAESAPMNLPQSLLEKIEGSNLEFIAAGGFADVYKVQYDGHPFVVKKMINEAVDDLYFCRELDTLRKLKHKNVVRLLAYYAQTQLISGNGNGETCSYVVNTKKRMLLFEYVPNGTLAAYIKRCFAKQESIEASQVHQVSNVKEPADKEDGDNNSNRSFMTGESLPSAQLKSGTSAPAKTSQVMRPRLSLSPEAGPDMPPSPGKVVPPVPGTSAAEAPPPLRQGAELIMVPTATVEFGSSGDLKWTTHYRIIKGICNGLNYIHQTKLVHADLNPNNILLDENEMPKIADFGLSRFLEEGKSSILVSNVAGTPGYMAPEYNNEEPKNRKITQKLDIFSLGLIIMEMLTGSREHPSPYNVLDSWKNMQADLVYEQLNQIQVCAQIGISCTNEKPDERPSIEKIMGMLPTEKMQEDGPKNLRVDPPSLLRIPFEPNKVATCLLELTNKNASEHVAFMLMDKSGRSSFLQLPLYGLVPPNTPYTLTVTTQKKKEVPEKGRIVDLILNCATLKLRDYKKTFKRRPNNFFEDMGKAVEEVKFKALCTPLPERVATSSSQIISPRIKIICEVKCHKYFKGYPLDTNDDKQWVITGGDSGNVRICDYETQALVHSLTLSAEAITCVKFIAREKWIVAGTEDGMVLVYDYEENQEIRRFSAGESVPLVSLAVHPAKRHLLTWGMRIKLWDWGDSWKHVYELAYERDDFLNPPGFGKEQYKLAFSPNGTIANAATALGDSVVEVWNFHSENSKYDTPVYLEEHKKTLNCLVFITCNDKQYLVTGSDDKTAKIWCLHNMMCVCTLKAFLSPVTSVLFHPNLQTLITGSKDGDIYLWSTTKGITNPKLERIINVGSVGAVSHLAYKMGGVVVGKENVVAIVDINNVDYQEHSAGGEQQSNTETPMAMAGYTSSLLDVYPLELRFPYYSDEPISCSLQLTNNTDDNVAFRLVDKSSKSTWCFKSLPLYGIVPCRSTYTLIVTTKQEMKLKRSTDSNIVIQSTAVGNKCKVVFKDRSESNYIFKDAEYLRKEVSEVPLKAVYVKPKEIKSKDDDILVKYYRDSLLCIDAHPTKAWILTGHKSGYVRMWNHEVISCGTQQMISWKPWVGERNYEVYTGVYFVKFITRRKRILVMTRASHLHLYEYEEKEENGSVCVTKIKFIRIFIRTSDDKSLPFPVLAVHPTQPYVLSPYEVLNWDQEWDTKHTFKSKTTFYSATFNPQDESFAIGDYEGVVKVWRIGSPNPEYSLTGHANRVNCLAFITRGDQQYLVSGSDDCNAKIWDLEKRECIRTLEAMSPVTCVHPDLLVVVTGSKHGIIHVWSGNDFRLKRTINLGGGGPVQGLTCLTGSPRIVIGQENAISFLDLKLDDEAERSQAEAEHGETEEPLPPKCVTPLMQHCGEKRPAQGLTARDEAESSQADADEPAVAQEQHVLDIMTHKSARLQLPSKD